ncbi:MAG: sulfur carrier protein ThiS [Burkholderiales bacterium]|nr:sulfur carrier protein ThiS [Burkholderiales bacterium]MBS0415291.1 sulfur carrier protein ThiS [Pseudomonadota bacterium]HMN57858.1 sulfur carrier protein ThiS [Ottowia sp.]
MSPSPSTSTVTIQVDGHARDVAPGTTLAQLVEALGHAPQAVSTAVNAEFVARAARGDRVLRAGDQVLLFQPIVGG